TPAASRRRPTSRAGHASPCATRRSGRRRWRRAGTGWSAATRTRSRTRSRGSARRASARRCSATAAPPPAGWRRGTRLRPPPLADALAVLLQLRQPAERAAGVQEADQRPPAPARTGRLVDRRATRLACAMQGVAHVVHLVGDVVDALAAPG